MLFTDLKKEKERGSAVPVQIAIQKHLPYTYRGLLSQAPFYSPLMGHFVVLSVGGSDAVAQCFGLPYPQEPVLQF